MILFAILITAIVVGCVIVGLFIVEAMPHDDMLAMVIILAMLGFCVFSIGALWWRVLQ